MILKCSNNSYFVVNRREINKTYPFELFENKDINDNIQLMSLITSFAMNSLQPMNILEEIHKKISILYPEVYAKAAIYFIKKKMLRQKKDEFSFFEHIFSNEEKILRHRDILMSHLLTEENLNLRRLGVINIPNIPIRGIASIINYCKIIYKKFPRSAVNAIKHHLQNIEKDEEKFDRLLIYDKNPLKYIYASLHIKPSERADNILFKNKMPKGSFAEALKLLRTTKYDSNLICSIIDKYSLTAEDALNTISHFSYKISKKILDMLEPEDMLRLYPKMKRLKMLKDEDILWEIKEKIYTLPKKQPKMEARRVKKYVRQPDMNLKSQIYAYILQFLEKRYSINKDITLLIDISGSMYAHQEIGKAFVHIFSSLMSDINKLHVWTFSTEANEINIKDPKWKSFPSIDPENISTLGSSPSSILLKMGEKAEKTDVIIIIGDGNENGEILFSEAYKKYVEQTKIFPYPIFIKCGYISDKFETNLQYGDITCFVTEFTDYENVISEISPFIFSKSFNDTMHDIMSETF